MTIHTVLLGSRQPDERRDDSSGLGLLNMFSRFYTVLSTFVVVLLVGVGPTHADTVNSDTINVKNNTASGSWPASIKESYCTPSGGYNPTCSPSSGQVVTVGNTGVVTVSQTVGTYDVLANGSFQYVSQSIEPGGAASIASCTWTYKINKNPSSGVWTGTVTVVAGADPAQSYTPVCTWNYTSVNATTGAFVLNVGMK